MKRLLFLVPMAIGMLLSLSASAQSFFLYDTAGTVITGDTMYVNGVNATQLEADIDVENASASQKNVRAGKTELSVVAGSSNAFTWGLISYPPNADSSLSYAMVIGGIEPFQGLYFPNNMAGTSWIRYCFWDAQNVNDKSCVTVSYNNVLAGIHDPQTMPPLFLAPNPATDQLHISFDWPESSTRVEAVLYDAFGRPVKALQSENHLLEGNFVLNDLTEGLYFCRLYADGVSLLAQKVVVKH